jgi:hypothetical protein
MAHVFHCQAVVQVGFTAMFSAAGRKGGNGASFLRRRSSTQDIYTHGIPWPITIIMGIYIYIMGIFLVMQLISHVFFSGSILVKSLSVLQLNPSVIVVVIYFHMMFPSTTSDSSVPSVHLNGKSAPETTLW